MMVLRWLARSIGKGRRHAVEVVGPNGNKGSTATNVLVELVLNINEALERVGVELHISNNGRHHERSHSLSRGLDTKSNRRRWKRYRIQWRVFLLKEHTQATS